MEFINTIEKSKKHQVKVGVTAKDQHITGS